MLPLLELLADPALRPTLLATAMLASGKRDEALDAIDRSLALDATDEANRARAERIRAGRPRTSPLTRLRDSFARWRRR